MRVVIDELVFADKKINQSDLHALLRLGFQNKHYIQIDYNNDGLSSFESWINRLDPALKEEYQLGLDSGLEEDAINPAFYELKISASNLQEYLKLLEGKFKIVLENRENDKNFLLAVATGNKKAALQKVIDKHFIEFENGGGVDGIKTYIEAECAKYPLQKMRMWAMFDSDMLYPDKPSKQSEKVRIRCCDLDVAHHQLQRRAIENYLPIPLLEALTEHKKNRDEYKRKVRAFGKFSLEQRICFNMRDGFKGDANRNNGDSADDLYEGLNAKTKENLNNGFGNDISELFDSTKYSHQESWFIDDQLSEEIKPMLDKLFSLL
jgi:hypothetical protein